MVVGRDVKNMGLPDRPGQLARYGPFAPVTDEEIRDQPVKKIEFDSVRENGTTIFRINGRAYSPNDPQRRLDLNMQVAPVLVIGI